MSMSEIKSHIEGVKNKYGQTVVVGWAVGTRPDCVVAIRVQENTGAGAAGTVQGLTVRRIERPDIQKAFFASWKGRIDYGFRLSFPSVSFIQGEGEQRGCFLRKKETEYVLTFYDRDNPSTGQYWLLRGNHFEMATAKGKRDWKPYLKKKVKGLLGRGRENRGEALGKAPQENILGSPLFSIIVPVYMPDPAHYREMLESVMAQRYGRFQLCLADGSPENAAGHGLGAASYEKLTKEICGEDGRVAYRWLPENLGISGNTNAALEMAKGEWIAMLDHDDLLEPDALQMAAAAISENQAADFFYTDSDLTDYDGMKYYNPLYKPDWSPEMMYSANYITHFSVIRRSLLEEAGGFDKNFDGAQDWDIFLKVSEKARGIVAIHKVLYHWRVAPTSTARSIETKPYALDAQLRAVNSHFGRMGYPGEAYFEDRERYLIRIRWDWEVQWTLMDWGEYAGENAGGDQGRLGKTGEDQGNWAVEGKIGGTLPKVKVIWFGTCEKPSEEACRELAAWAVLDGIGLVFPKILRKDGTIASAGIQISGEGETQVLYKGKKDHTADERGNTDWYRNVSSQLPAVLAVSEKIWKEEGTPRTDLEPEKAVEEYAGGLRRAGYRHLMNPFSIVHIP